MATLDTASDNRLKLTCTYVERDLAKQIPNAHWNKQDCAWYYPFSQERIALFKKHFPDGQITEAVNQAEKRHSEFEDRLLELKSLKQCDFIEDTFCKIPLLNHQKIAVNYLFNINCAMLADELGLGKTATSLIVSQMRKAYNQIKKCLIICPATTKYSVWAREIEKFTNDKYLVIDGAKKKREELYHTFLERDDVFYLIVNYESLITDVANLKAFPLESMIISDESIYIKTPKAQRTKAVKSIKTNYKIAVTGYPVANKIPDIWSQFDWLMPGFLGSFWQFQDKYLDFLTLQKRHTEETKETGKNCKCKKCGKWSPEQKYAAIYTCRCADPEWENPGFRKLIGYKNLDELRKKIEPYYIRRLKKDVLDLPPKIYEEREVRLSGELLKAYNEMKEDMRVQIKNMRDEEIVAKANGILIQMLRLSQLTCGFLTDKELKHPYFYKENPKVDALDEIIDEVVNSDRKIVVWTRFRAFMAHIYKRYAEGFKCDKEHRQYKCAYLWGGMSAKEKDDNINAFQTDLETKIIVGTVQTGGMGITLHAGSVEVFTDLSFLSPSTIIQAESRLHRIGQKNSVVIIKLIAKKMIDEHWLKLLEHKQKASRMLFEDDESVKIGDKETLLELLE